MRNIWKGGIFGVVTGDALGCPVQFESRETVAKHPVTGMRGYGAIPPEWIAELKKKEWIEELCEKADRILSLRSDDVV